MKTDSYTFSRFKPKVVNDLIRLGNKNEDGGYVMSKRQLDVTKVLIGLGINYDWTFEAEFKKSKKDLLVYCYDFSIGKLIYIKGFILSILNIFSLNSYANILFRKIKPKTLFTQPFIELSTLINFSSFFKAEKNNFFFQLGVSNYGDNIFITIEDVFAKIKGFNELPANSIYIKMDIESSEYDILGDIIKHHSKINGLVIEFHNTKQLWQQFNDVVGELQNYFEIIHVHGNNYGGYIPDTQIPNLIEISFMNKTLMDEEELNSINNKQYPLDTVDVPNMRNRPDLKLSF
jgi:hypothetical protein